MNITIEEFWKLLGKSGWQGYIWRIADKNGPTIYQVNELILRPQKTAVYNRILEANFFNKKNNISLHVKQIDGKELAYKYELSNYTEIKGYKLSEEETMPSAKESLGRLKFKNLNQLTTSSIGAPGMGNWILVAQLFTGF